MSVNKSDLVTIRDYNKDTDHNFIIATWLRGLRYGNDWYGMIEQDAYFSKYHEFIELLLNNGQPKIRVACLKSDDSVILGYSVTRNNDEILDFMFVKKAWRMIGIAKSIVPQSIKRVTHVTKIGVSLMKKKPEILFNPFI